MQISGRTATAPLSSAVKSGVRSLGGKKAEKGEKVGKKSMKKRGQRKEVKKE